jgi:1-phosphofructokinase family hexose kinase
LNPAVDVVYDIGEVQPGSTVTDVPARIVPAGKGINVAKAIKTLGEEVRVVGVVHENNRAQFSQYLHGIGIVTHFISVPGTTRINVTLVETKVGQSTHINSAVAGIPSSVENEVMHYFESNVSSGDMCLLCGSIPRGMDTDAYKKLIKICKEKGAIVLLDTHGDALKMGVRAKPHMVKPNLEELEGFFNEKIQGVHHIALKGKRLEDMGVDYVFISLGSDGMIAIHENDCLLCSAPSVRALDTVGSGDAVVAGLTVGHKRQFSFSEMCRMAMACGASNAMHFGPGTITRDEVWQLMEEVRIKAI